MLARIYEDDQIKTLRDVGEIRAAIRANKPIWIVLETQSAATDQVLIDAFGIHPLTIEDIWVKRNAPKLEDYRTYLYVIVHGIRAGKRGAIDLVELDIVIGKTFVITHDPAGEITKDVVDAIARDPAL